jgi:hypothetical protein
MLNIQIYLNAGFNATGAIIQISLSECGIVQQMHLIQIYWSTSW